MTTKDAARTWLQERERTGGPAFPSHPHPDSSSTDDGMSLRDYFAAKAMQVLLAGGDVDLPNEGRGISKRAYMLADAMLKARK